MVTFKGKKRKKKKDKELKAISKPDPQILSVSDFQTGKSFKQIDRLYSAMPPGKRKSKRGNVYYEYRRNRTDKDLEKKI